MSPPPDSHKRRHVRLLLLAGMVVSALGLYAVLAAGPLRGWGAAPALARATVRVKIVDQSGHPIPHADVFLLAASNDAPAKASWVPESGVLTISSPGGGTPTPRALRITARGYRTRDVQGIIGDEVAVLQPGLQMRVLLRDMPTNMPNNGIPPHIRVLLRIRPAGVNPSTAGASEIIGLMDNLGAPGSGPRDIPRGGFGYAVSLAQARAGVILPEPGSFHVHWGLIDTRANTWFSLGKRCGRVFRVRDMREVQTFTLAMSFDHLQETLDGLEAGVKQVRR